MVAFTAASVLTASALNSAFNAYTVNAQTGTTYTFVLTDQGGLVTASNASASTYTVPTNASVAYATGTRIELLNIGAGTVTLSPAGGVTLTGTTTVPQNGRVVLVKQATNTWYSNPMGGGGLTFITSATASAAATLSVNGCFTSAYNAYRIIYAGTGSAATQDLNIRMRASAADDTTANYSRQSVSFASTTVTAGILTAQTTTRIAVSDTTQTALTADIIQPAAASPTIIYSTSSYSATGPVLYNHVAVHNVSSSFDGFTLYPASGTITGTVRVYGYQN
jgi:hypothetical protein